MTVIPVHAENQAEPNLFTHLIKKEKTMLKYNVLARKSPIDNTAKYYAQVTSPTPVKFQQLAEAISAKCTVTIHDVKAVLSALEEEIANNLRNGASVRLGDLGTFRATISSNGALTRDEFSAKNISRVNIRFFGSRNMRHKLSVDNPDMQFMKAGDIVTSLGPVEEE